MRKLVALVGLVFAVSCTPTQPEDAQIAESNQMRQIAADYFAGRLVPTGAEQPGELYRFGGDDDMPNKAGDDDEPTVECDLAGPPSMLWNRNGVTKWKDLCGGIFWQVTDESFGQICVGNWGAILFQCNGFGG